MLETFPQPKAELIRNLNLMEQSPELLDGTINTAEIITSLAKCKNGNAPGIDEVSNLFLKNLPQNWIFYLEILFSKVLQSEVMTKEWGKSITVTFLKKGNNMKPENYRLITLINCVAKIFTQILNARIIKWTTEMNIIPESQSGFRGGRSYADNLFVLLALIQIHLRNPGTAVYAIFIDFKGAFPSVDHNLLWKKLYVLGMSSKMINIIKNFYDLAQTCVRTSEGCSEFVTTILVFSVFTVNAFSSQYFCRTFNLLFTSIGESERRTVSHV